MECSLGLQIDEKPKSEFERLNPYSNGMLTWNVIRISYESNIFVLILIIMECSLGSLPSVKKVVGQ